MTELTLLDLVHRKAVPEAWEEGDNIPWSDPEFGRRMLAEHLSQAHDLASRRLVTVERHVDWIHRVLLGGQPKRVLDLGCGPGLYTSRLAALGHQCTGIDYSPVSVAYAVDQAKEAGHACSYVCEDIRTAEYGGNFDLVMLIFGEFNVFRPTDAKRILSKAYRALTEGGTLLLETSSPQDLRKEGRTWHSAEKGLFSDKPYLCLEETHWDEASKTTTTRFFVVDASSGGVSRCALSNQLYSEEQYEDLLSACGFTSVTFYPTLGEGDRKVAADLIAIIAQKPGHES